MKVTWEEPQKPRYRIPDLLWPEELFRAILQEGDWSETRQLFPGICTISLTNASYPFMSAEADADVEQFMRGNLKPELAEKRSLSSCLNGYKIYTILF
jgi:hypothetical protein